jgi:PIN domain nuclease of toxin-antitoxin system
VKLLLDTHVVLWWLTDDDRLSQEASDVMSDGRNAVLVSAASVWEVEIKRAKGALAAPDDLIEQVEAAGFSLLSVGAVHARAAGRLPRHHDDPFDRMLVAQAVGEGATLLTADRSIARYAVPLMAAD